MPFGKGPILSAQKRKKQEELQTHEIKLNKNAIYMGAFFAALNLVMIGLQIQISQKQTDLARRATELQRYSTIGNLEDLFPESSIYTKKTTRTEEEEDFIRKTKRNDVMFGLGSSVYKPLPSTFYRLIGQSKLRFLPYEEKLAIAQYCITKLSELTIWPEEAAKTPDMRAKLFVLLSTINSDPDGSRAIYEVAEKWELKLDILITDAYLLKDQWVDTIGISFTFADCYFEELPFGPSEAKFFNCVFGKSNFSLVMDSCFDLCFFEDVSLTFSRFEDTEISRCVFSVPKEKREVEGSSVNFFERSVFRSSYTDFGPSFVFRACRDMNGEVPESKDYLDIVTARDKRKEFRHWRIYGEDLH